MIYNNSFSRVNNKVPEKYVNKIVCADCMEVLKELPDNCIDIIFTSPPYNFDMGYDKYNDSVSNGKYFKMLFDIFSECIRVLKYGGRFVINIAAFWSEYVPTHHIIGTWFLKNKMIWRGEIIWEKNNYNCAVTAWGSYASPSSPYLKTTWEFVEVYSKGDLKKEGNASDIDILPEEFQQWVNARWSIAPESNMKKFGHPAMFPVALAERVLKLFSFKNDMVLDPFNGCGTTSLVARNTGRRYLGIDISEDYCKKAEERLLEQWLNNNG